MCAHVTQKASKTSVVGQGVFIPIKLEGDPLTYVARYAAEYIQFNWVRGCYVWLLLTLTVCYSEHFQNKWSL